MSTIKYLRAVIKLGSLSLEVFQSPNGSYRLSQTQILQAICVDKSWISKVTKRGDESLKALRGNGFTGVTESVSIPLSSGGKSTAKTLSVDDAVLIWGYFASQGNQEAVALIVACAIEAIERRADAAFNVQRDEEERNARLEARRKGIVTRRELTDAIQDYLERSEASENAAKWAYSNATNAMYRAVFGMTATELEAFLSCTRNASRDFLAMNSLRAIDFAENFICRLIDDRAMEPMEAVRFAVEIAGIKVSQPVAKSRS